MTTLYVLSKAFLFITVVISWFIVHQLEGKPSLTSNGFWNTTNKYTAWKLRNFIQLMMKRFFQLWGTMMNDHINVKLPGKTHNKEESMNNKKAKIVKWGGKKLRIQKPRSVNFFYELGGFMKLLKVKVEVCHMSIKSI